MASSCWETAPKALCVLGPSTLPREHIPSFLSYLSFTHESFSWHFKIKDLNFSLRLTRTGYHKECGGGGQNSTAWGRGRTPLPLLPHHHPPHLHVTHTDSFPEVSVLKAIMQNPSLPLQLRVAQESPSEKASQPVIPHPVSSGGRGTRR